jgi:hypothetical protein
MCVYAVSWGHLDCLKYAHENGAPWDERICAQASKNGHIDCLRYAFIRGAPWNTKPDEMSIHIYRLKHVLNVFILKDKQDE